MNIWLKTFLGVLVAIPLIFASIIWLLFDINILWSDCDRIDYSPIIKKVAVPMQEELEKFHHETKRLPTLKERDILLEKVGCKVEGNVCIYRKERIEIITYTKSYNFRLKLRVGKTGCLFGIQDDTNHDKVECDNSRCHDLGQ